MTVAALFVETGGVYFGVPGVEPYDVVRDAMTYRGPHPVVCHSPCARWCQLAPVNQARYGLKIGADGGAFAHAIGCVRDFGGVLEHPANSLAWPAFGLHEPTPGAWTRDLFDGAWVAEVCQRNYGHPATKRTWLYARVEAPPPLDWSEPEPPEAWISSDRPRAELGHVRQLSSKEASRTPIPFRDLLLSIARSARPSTLENVG